VPATTTIDRDQREGSGGSSAPTWIGSTLRPSKSVRLWRPSTAAAESPWTNTRANESGIRLVAHRRRERDADLPRRKRAQVKRLTGALACEACGFDSDAAWGVEGIVECHHLLSVSELEPGQTTKLADVRLLCPNCHRLVHSRSEWLAWEELLDYVR
jgi:5-methylcytosine-specific restriction enzyme A